MTTKEEKHTNKADVKGLNEMYKALGTIQSALLMHIEDLTCECQDTLTSAAISISATKDAIGDVIDRHSPNR